MKTAIDLQRDVVEELAWEPSVDAADIGVTVKDGVVTLAGHVATFAEKDTAERTALGVAGIRGVVNELSVHVPGLHERNDQDVAEAALHALGLDVRIPAGKIQLVVKNSRITLTGSVDAHYQREAAFADVRNLAGVRGVANHITVTPRMTTPGEVRAQIARAFERSAQLDAEKITIDVRGSKVILHGKVNSMIERIEAGRAAWSAPGVTAVDNDLTVTP